MVQYVWVGLHAAIDPMAHQQTARPIALDVPGNVLGCTSGAAGHVEHERRAVGQNVVTAGDDGVYIWFDLGIVPNRNLLPELIDVLERRESVVAPKLRTPVVVQPGLEKLRLSVSGVFAVIIEPSLLSSAHPFDRRFK